MGEAKRKKAQEPIGNQTVTPPCSNTGGKVGDDARNRESYDPDQVPSGSFADSQRDEKTGRIRVNLSVTPQIYGLLDEASSALGLSVSQIALSALLQGLPTIRSQIDSVQGKNRP